MNILILGSGAREKVILDILQNDDIKYYNQNIIYLSNSVDFNEIYLFCINKNIDLVIPSCETLLSKGINDYLINLIPKIFIFGPDKLQSRIEGSKLFSKNLMKELNIPSSDFTFCENSNSLDLENLYNFTEYPVIKYSGLAKGKGVCLPNSYEEFVEDLNYISSLGNEEILIEKRVFGEEISLLAFCNGKEAYLMPQAKDYKKVFDNDEGPNTGGMGSISPVNILDENEIKMVKYHMDLVVKKLKYKGILYAGLIKSKKGVFFLEFNCRFGDPEAQVILNLLEIEKVSLTKILLDCIHGNDIKLSWKKKKALCLVLSEENYPYSKDNDLSKILFTYEIEDSIKIYESNTVILEKEKYRKSGRIMSLVSLENNFYDCYKIIYNTSNKILYDNMYYRRDIGYKYLIEEYTNFNNHQNINIALMSSSNGTAFEKLFQYESQCIKIIIIDNYEAKIIETAKIYNIPFFILPTLKSSNKYQRDSAYEQITNLFRQFNIDLIILAGYMGIIPSMLYNDIYTINIHPSLLPKYKGKKNLEIYDNILVNNDKFTGCTLHKVNNIIDGGEILIQKQFKINKIHTILDLKDKVQKLEKDSILEFVYLFKKIKNNGKINYNVDIESSNLFVEELKMDNSFIGGFSSIFPFKNMKFAASADGTGTKIDLAIKYNTLDTIGIDLVAMNINDLIAGGAKPLFFLDYIALDRMDKKKCNLIIKGIYEGCKISDCKLIGGETAEMRGIYLKDKCDIAGFAIGEKLYDLPRCDIMDNTCILYGIKSSGLHSNGYTLINDLLKNDPDIHLPGLMTPTRIYIEVLELYENYKEHILGISHITGGGFKDNIKRILPNNLDFRLNNWEFPEIFTIIQQKSNLSKNEMLNIFNCGYGMVLICKNNFSFSNNYIKSLQIDKIGHLINMIY